MTAPEQTPNESRISTWLAEHPRFMGALFVTLVLLSKAGSVAANGANATAGP